jgi:hypothetical protein
MDTRPSVNPTCLLGLVYILLTLVYLLASGYFILNGLRFISGGSLLIGLACLSGVSLFLTPLWLMKELERTRHLYEQQNRILFKLIQERRHTTAQEEVLVNDTLD